MATATTNTAVINAPSRKLFAPMFRARWQNMQNIVNDSAFINLIPEPYKTYYMTFTRQCLQWSRGFVPSLHSKDFFSTGMGYTVCEILTRECLRGGYRIESINDEVQAFMENWEQSTSFANELYRMFFFTVSGGNSLFVLTPCDGEVHATAYPCDRYIATINRKEKVSACEILNRFTSGDICYYAREQRQVLNGEGYYKVQIATGGGIATSPSWGTDFVRELPKDIKEAFSEVYGSIEINKWYKLPFKGIGAYNIKNKAVAVAISDLPGYSDSSLYSALDILYSIDYNFTQAQVDMYKGKSIVLIPKQMSSAVINTGRVNTANGVSFTEAIQQSELKDDFYTEVMTPTGEPIKPTFVQADLRAEAHKYIRDADLEILASKVGLSSSTLANHLSYQNSKTATEIRNEQDTTETTIRTKRELASVPLNEMLTEIARFYGYESGVEINWGRAGVNTADVNAELMNDYQNGTLPLKRYLMKRWSDLSEEEADVWVKELEEEQSKKQKQESFGQGDFDMKDYFGDENGQDNTSDRDGTERDKATDRAIGNK